MIKETIIAYVLLCDFGITNPGAVDGLNKQVSEHIKDGWQPFMAPYESDRVTRVCQAVVKYQD